MSHFAPPSLFALEVKSASFLSSLRHVRVAGNFGIELMEKRHQIAAAASRSSDQQIISFYRREHRLSSSFISCQSLGLKGIWKAFFVP